MPMPPERGVPPIKVSEYQRTNYEAALKFVKEENKKGYKVGGAFPGGKIWRGKMPYLKSVGGNIFRGGIDAGHSR